MIFRRTHPHVDVKLIRAVAPQLLARLERGELHTVVAIGEPTDTRRPMIEHKRLAEEVRPEGEWGNSTSLTRRRRGRYADESPEVRAKISATRQARYGKEAVATTR